MGHHPGQHGDRHERREHDLRQVAGEERLERLDALYDGGRQLAGALARQPGRPRLDQALGEAFAQLAHHRQRRRSARPRRSAARDGAARHDDAGQQAERAGDGGHGGAVEEHAVDDARQQHGLGHDERGADRADDAGDGERAARGACLAQQTAGDRVHQSSAVRRRRKTQYVQPW